MNLNAVVGGLRQSCASLHPPFGTSFLSGAAHEVAAGHALAEPSDNCMPLHIMKETGQKVGLFFNCLCIRSTNNSRP